MSEKSTRLPTLLEASTPILAMLILLGLGYAFFDLAPEPILIVSTVIAGILALRVGYSYEDVLVSISQKIAKTMPALLILISVGLLIGTWLASGTIPLMIYYGLKMIDPKYLYITALLLTSVVSVCTGTSWGSAGTVGVAFMGVAVGLDANLAVAAGAIISGAYFGDKLSPLSDTTNLASAATGVNLYEHIYNLWWTTVPSYLVAASVYIFYGLNIGVENVATPEKVQLMISNLETIYNFNLVLLVPVAIILWGSITKKPTIPVMLLSASVAIICAIVFQSFSVHNIIDSALNGFNVSMIDRPDLEITSDISRLLNRGGMNSMMSTLLICFCALSFVGAISVSKALDILLQGMLKLVHSTFSLVFTTILCGITMISVTCNGQISILMPAEMLREAYIKRGVHPKVLGRTVEDSGSLFEPLLPWTAAGAYMAGTLGVPTLEYVPWSIFSWSAIIFAMIWASTGIGITYINETQQKEMLNQV